MKKKTMKTLLLSILTFCFLLTTSNTPFTSNIPEDTTSQIMPLSDLTHFDDANDN